jgi:hypothetical protein
MREVASGHDEQFEAIVEHGRVAAVSVDHRQELLDIIAEQIGLEVRLGGVHPVGIATERVDFAVMRDVSVRVTAVPARECVR